MGNLLIYSAAEIFCIWPRALPRCRRCRASLGRKPIHRGRCIGSLAFLPANQPTSANACSANGCRTGWGSRSSSITDRASPASLSALRRS